MKRIIFAVFALVLFSSLTACSTRRDENKVPRFVKVTEFNKTPMECDEIVNNLKNVSKSKRSTIYKFKAILNDQQFNVGYHLMNNPSDVAIATNLGNGDRMIIILTNDLPTYRHLKVGLGD